MEMEYDPYLLNKYQQLMRKHFTDGTGDVEDTLTGEIWTWTKTNLAHCVVELCNEETCEVISVGPNQYKRFQPIYD